jgi:hypothetical protein
MCLTKRFVLIIGLVTLVGSVLPFLVVADQSNQTNGIVAAKTSPEANLRLSPESSVDQAGSQVLLLEVRPFGFISPQLTVPPGRYLVVLQNRTGKRGLTFRLARENGTQLSESRPQNRDWKAQVVLASGTYILSEASEPSWRCVISVVNP